MGWRKMERRGDKVGKGTGDGIGERMERWMNEGHRDSRDTYLF